ncbi:MAG: alpha/beta fold hydrolase [Candidatus Hodarchaeales archaeon]
MPEIAVNEMKVYHEIHGEGQPLVFIQGAFISSTMWKPQVDHFSKNYKVITYDIRGHGKTGSTTVKKYSIELYANDLLGLLDALEIEKPVICGLSLGGMIAQVFATKYPDRLSGLILSDTAASLTITTWDKIMRLMFPKWSMIWSLRLMGVHRFIHFSFWLAEKTRSKEWLGNSEIIKYEKSEMINLDKKEYLKIFGSLYDFKLQELSKIKVPTLVLNGEHETPSLFKHAEKMKSLIPDCEVDVISKAGHVTNLENVEEFNTRIQEFLTGMS